MYTDNRYTRLAFDPATLPWSAPRFATEAPQVAGLEVVGDSFQSPHASRLSWLTAQIGDLMRPRTALDALVMTRAREGTILRWKADEKGVSIPYLHVQGAGGFVPDPVAVDVGDGAEAAIFLHWSGDATDVPALTASLLSGDIGRHASLKAFLLHEDGTAHHALSIDLRLQEGAKVSLYSVCTGGEWVMVRERVEIAGEGARWEETHAVLGGGQGHFDLDTRVRHAAPRTGSDVQVKAALAGRSRGVVTGNILIEPASPGATASLKSHALMLSPGARADMIPGLEIKARDVQASHAASMSRVDDGQMYYLSSRGLDPEAARRLLVAGFLGSLSARAPFPFVEAIVDPLIERKVAAS